MKHTDPRIDAYIAAAAPFARPILRHIRAVVHDGCPDVVETMKWSTPSFEHHGVLCGMASFKAHCMIGFWKAELLAEQFPNVTPPGQSLLRLGGIKAIKDLPARSALVKVVKAAAKLNEDGVKLARPVPSPKKTIRAPADLLAALRNNPQARAGYEALSPSHKREYIEWITEARRDETRRQRVDTAVEWMAEGKIRNWKYVR